MTLHRAVCLGVGVGVGVFVACGERFEAGLANAPSIERKSEPRQTYDVITGGEEGCASRDGGASIASARGGCKQIPGNGIADASGDAQLSH
jgi:hypothetical protein